MATSPLPFQRPKRGRNCYVTPVFSGAQTQPGTTQRLAVQRRRMVADQNVGFSGAVLLCTTAALLGKHGASRALCARAQALSAVVYCGTTATTAVPHWHTWCHITRSSNLLSPFLQDNTQKSGALCRGCRNGKKKLRVSNTPYDGGRWVTDGGWWVTDGGWWVTDGGWCVTDGGWWVSDGGWCATDGGWWVATKHQRVDAIVKKKKGERPYGTPCHCIYRGTVHMGTVHRGTVMGGVQSVLDPNPCRVGRGVHGWSGGGGSKFLFGV